MERLPDVPDQNHAPVVSIVGDKVALGPVSRDLLPLYLKWENDFQVASGFGLRLVPTTLDRHETWFNEVSTSKEALMFTIYRRPDLRPVGNTGLNHLDHFHRTAEFFILIGEKDCWRQGYGTETTRLVLDYGFTALGLHAIMLHVFEFNQSGIRAYTRAGFRQVGRLREAYRLAGKAYDVIIMDCLATEFESPVLRRLLTRSERPTVRP